MSVTSFLIPLSTAICVFLLTYTAADWVWAVSYTHLTLPTILRV